MNLKERMQHQNKNNSSILNNSNFDFAKINKEDQIYQKSRQECEDELYKRKSQLQQQKYAMLKIKEKELNSALEKFNNDFQEVRKQIINQINLSLSETKAKYLAQIRQRCLVETNEQQRVKNGIEDLLSLINSHLVGLKKQQYREYIARIVTTDFDTPKQDIKGAIKRIKHPTPAVVMDDKSYNCLRNDLSRAVVLDFNMKRQPQNESVRQAQSISRPNYLSVDINLHQNRDRLKKSFT